MAIIDITACPFYADNTGVNDCSAAIQMALDPTYAHNAVGQTLYFPKGRYLLNPATFTSSIILPDAGVVIMGDGQFGTSNVLITTVLNNNITVGSFGSNFMFKTPDTSYAGRIEISNITFNGENILDLRQPFVALGGGPSDAYIFNCAFSSPAIGKGVAISMLNHDWSTILRCNFYSFYGLCSIRILGMLQVSGPYSDNKATTQVGITDCAFASSKIGISCELVDSIKITGNDFGGVIVPMDIGGNEYWQNIQTLFPTQPSTGHYFRGANDITTSGVTWDGTNYPWTVGGSAGTGWFSNVNIKDNHMESFTTGIAVNGSRFTQNRGTKIESNNFAAGSNSAVMIYLKNAAGVSTLYNDLYFGNYNSAIGIKYDGTRSCRLILDNFYGSDSGNNPNAYVPIGTTNYNPLIWMGISGGKGFIDTATTGRAKFDSDVFAKLPAVGNTGQLAEKTYSIEQRISKYNLAMSNVANNTLVLLDPFAGLSCGILTLYVYNSIGTFCSVYAVGTDTIARISTESSTPSVYTLTKSGGQLIYTQIYVQTNVDTFVSGTFTGIQ
jgi:hypothetical protein